MPVSRNVTVHTCREEVLGLLENMRPVTWRGRDDLVQFPWGEAPRGTFLVVDAWSGISGLCVALLATGIHFYGVATEIDSFVIACVSKAMPNIVHIGSMESLDASMLIVFVKRRTIRGIIIGGSCPHKDDLHVSDSHVNMEHGSMAAALLSETHCHTAE